MKKYSIQEVFDLIGKENLMRNNDLGNRPDIIVDGHKVRTVSLRYMTFYQKGTRCACCGREGTHFLLEASAPTKTDRMHFNLYSDDDVLMTKDHIIPKSLGGSNTVVNLQTMCQECNMKKGNTPPEKMTVRKLKWTKADGETGYYKSLESAVHSIVAEAVEKHKKSCDITTKLIVKWACRTAANLSEAIVNGNVYDRRTWEYVNMEIGNEE